MARGGFVGTMPHSFVRVGRGCLLARGGGLRKKKCNMRTSKEIRDDFLAFFEERGHTFVPSSPLLPAEDPTLLFANAGMNQFKAIFLGSEMRDYNRAHNSQKCIRAGGKHNDLEDVGHDCYHHTFFEMLGNWSFGDYFKAEAIEWAWTLMTEVWGLPKDRLYATVFGGDEADGLAPDEEAERLWIERTDIDPSHISRHDKKDNFWEMGETGPCGPCSEIHIDLTPDGTGADRVNADSPDVIELWNLVFIQYNRGDDGVLNPLPACHVDTGAGFERVCAVLQGKKSNYATDLFVPIIEKIETMTDHRYGAASGLDDRFDVTSEEDIRDVACRVLADHVRTLTFAIADGIVPGNKGRNYVLQRILRRGVRYGRQHLGIEGPVITPLVGTVVELMSGMFPEIAERQQYIVETIQAEEAAFTRTLDRGIELFQRQADRVVAADGKQLSGEVAFELYATYGFPVDLTELMAEENGLTVDMAGYEAEMEAHRKTSGAGADAFKADAALDLPACDDSAKDSAEPLAAAVLGWVVDGQFITDGALSAGDEAAVVLDKTNFYAEQGGQVGDSGELTFDGGSFAVSDAQLAGPSVLHVGTLAAGELAAGQTVTCVVGPERAAIRRNHTGTHVLNWALRQVLGDHVNQAGSEVGPDRLRFDFHHNQAVGAEQLAEVERLANERILADEPVAVSVLPLAEAKQIPGVRAVFGEKYPDPVRVVAVGDAVEFCGGTHLTRTSQVGLLKIISEESVAKGVRRITALTGAAAVARVQELDAVVRTASRALKTSPDAIGERIVAMQKEIKALRKAPKGGSGAAEASFEVVRTVESPAGAVLIGTMPVGDPQAMRAECDRQRQKGAAAMLVAAAAGEGKVLLVAMASEAAVAECGIKAGAGVKAVAPVVGGGGGGKDTMAQAGGKDAAKIGEALTVAADWARDTIG